MGLKSFNGSKLEKRTIRLAYGCQSTHCSKVFYEVKSSRRTRGEVVK